MKFTTVSYFSKSGPGFSAQVTHIKCSNEKEAKRVTEAFKVFYPDLSPLVSVIETGSPRENVPFIHAEINAGSAKVDKFFRIKKWLKNGPAEPLLESISAVEWFRDFSEATGIHAAPVCDIFESDLIKAARKGGLATSTKKAESSRANGAKGGRPKKQSKTA